MSTTILDELGDQLTDDQVMNFTQGVRKKFLHYICEGGLPDDIKEQNIFLKTLSDMDRAALGNKKVGVTEKQTATDALVAKAISDIATKFGETNPFMAGGDGLVPSIEHELLPETNPVPGEMDIGVSDETYKGLMDKFD